jgi:outer membrane protein OmpA-like peptidoglycan-associated protein
MGIRINSSSSELAPVISADGKKLFFTRDKHPENMGADKKQDVWLSQLEEDGRFGKAVNLYEPVNSKDNNFAFSTNSDGRMLLMGRNANDANKSNLSITKYDSGKWSEIQDFDFVKLGNTSPLVSFSLSQSQNLMLISMERGDSYGGLDIYYSERTDNGWSEVKNLGSSINTAADEITPYIANDNRTIYFASNGYAGYGNMDLFVSRADDSLKNWSEPTNLGSNINTEGWEAYFTISSTNDYAYFVSTSNSIGKEDIFRVKLPQVAQPQKSVLVYGTVSELNSKHPIASTVEFRYLEDNKIVGIAYSDSTDGKYGISLPLGKLYSVNAFATGYYSLSKNIEIDSNFDENRAIDLVLKKIEVGQTYDMNNIFFEFGKSKLNTKSVNELQKLVKLLKSDSSLKILIIGYTDSIGSSEDNRKLSEDRAKAVYDYLVENGINKNRLEYEGKGELKSNNNSNLERSRKVVFKIVEDN